MEKEGHLFEKVAQVTLFFVSPTCFSPLAMRVSASQVGQ